MTYEKNLHKFNEILDIFNENGIEILDILTNDGDLEDVFVQITKN